MKTNKEIKPFKMLVSGNILEKIKKVLANFSIQIEEMKDMEDEDMFVLIKYPDSGVATLYSGSPFIYYSQPELTYSEFMKLYGEEEEFFTRDEMKEFAYYVLQTAAMGTENECDRLLTNFLSERAND